MQEQRETQATRLALLEEKFNLLRIDHDKLKEALTKELDASNAKGISARLEELENTIMYVFYTGRALQWGATTLVGVFVLLYLIWKNDLWKVMIKLSGALGI